MNDCRQPGNDLLTDGTGDDTRAGDPGIVHLDVGDGADSCEVGIDGTVPNDPEDTDTGGVDDGLLD